MCLLRLPMRTDYPSILQALTLGVANDCFAIQRLKVLGDYLFIYQMYFSSSQLTTGVFLYYKCLELKGFTMHEGDLTKKRSKIVRNWYLFKVAENDLANKILL